MRSNVVFLSLVLAVASAAANDFDTYDGMSLNIYGFSQHLHPNTVKPYNETNPGLGIRKHLGECFWQTANCFVGLNYIDKNSVNGHAYAASAGSKWTLLTTQSGYRVQVGATLEYVQYHNPRKGLTYHGFAPVPLLGFGKGPMDVEMSILAKNPLKALTGKEAHAAFLFSVNYRF